MSVLASNRYTIAFSTILATLLVANLIPGCSWPLPCDDLSSALHLRLAASDVASLNFEANLGQADSKYPYLSYGK